MDIPSLMLSSARECGSFMEQSIKFLKKQDGKELLNVWLELNCDNQSISFSPFAYQIEKSEKDFNYMGNNQSAAAQIYVVREANSLFNYWVGRMNGIFMNIWKILPESSLKEKLEQCRQKGLFDDSGLNFQYIEGIGSETKLYQDEKKKRYMLLNGEKLSAEKWLSCMMDLTSKQKLMLIVPVIVWNGQRTVISQDSDYIHYIESFLASDSGSKGRNKQMSVCHICGQLTDTIDTKTYCSKLDRYSISKVFVTTPINYAPEFNKKLHQKNFAICKSCYDKWFSAEKKIMQDYRLKVAGENAIVLIEGIGKKLDREDLSGIKRKVDVAFNPQKYADWFEELSEDYLEEHAIDLYEFNLLFYKTDGKSCSIKKSIEDISSSWFQYVMEEFSKCRMEKDYSGKLRYFSLESIYHMIPVRTSNKGEQLNIHRVLEFYAAILQRGVVESDVIFGYFSEAIEKGYQEITSSELRNYHNLYQIQKYHKLFQQDKQQCGIRSFEWYVQHMCFSYLALMELLQRLDILRNGVFRVDKLKLDNPADELEKCENVKEEDSKKTGINMIDEKEAFLNNHGFPEYSKGVYYVGAMMYQVGAMQYYQDHKNKPILNKVCYSGMSHRDIMRLLAELHEKIQQYRGAMAKKGKGYLSYNAERLAERAYAYLGAYPHKESSILEESDNLFYLLSGYCGCMSGERKMEEAENREDEND